MKAFVIFPSVLYDKGSERGDIMMADEENMHFLFL